MSGAAKIGRELREKISATIRDTVGLAMDALINATPVDTTNARNNWIFSAGRPHVGVDGSRESPSHSMQDSSKAALAKYDAGRDGPAYLQNHVIYMQFLDKGSSAQAPAGFVAAAFMAAVSGAAHGTKTAARAMLKKLSRRAYVKGW